MNNGSARKNGMSYKAKQGKTRPGHGNRIITRSWRPYMGCFSGDRLSSPFGETACMIQFYNASSCIILYHLVSIPSLDRFALRKWQLVSQVHTLRSSALWPRHSCQFQGQVARLPSHLTPWIQIDPMNLTSSMTCFSLTPPEQSTLYWLHHLRCLQLRSLLSST